MFIENELIQLIINKSKINKNSESLNVDINLINDLGIDSIALMELVYEIEEHFKIEIGDDDLDLDIISNYGKLCTLIKNQVNTDERK